MKRLAGWMLASPATLAITLLLVIPVAITVGLSFGSPGQGDWGLVQPYADFFSSTFRRSVLWRTFTVAGWVTVISLAAGLMTAYVVARCPPWMKSLLVVLAVFPLLTGVVVRSFAWLVLLGRQGIVNNALLGLGLVDQPLSMLYTPGAVIVAMIYIFVPLMVLVLVGVLENIPEDLLQASASLGAGPVAGFWQVTFPGLIVGAVLVFTASFTSYATPHLLGGTRQMMMGTFLQQRALVAFDWPGAAVVAAIMLAVIIVTVLVMTRLARHLNPMAT